MKLPTRQEMFDRAARGLRKQGFLRSMSGTACAYDDGAGKRCAWGHVDKILTSEDGTAGIYRLRQRGYSLASRLLVGDVGFAADLQDVHDFAITPKDMVRSLRAFARQYSLDAGVLK